MRDLKGKLSFLARRIAFYLLFFLSWLGIYYFGVKVIKVWQPYNFPSPLEVARDLALLMGDNTVMIAVIISVKRLLLGFFVALLLGYGLGVIMIRSRFLSENLSALILSLQTIPSICWIPFGILWFGLNEKAILFITALNASLSIAISFEYSIKSVNPLYVKAAQMMGLNRVHLFWKVVLPGALPNLISGLKQGWSFAWRGLMTGEMVFASVGLGQVLMMGRELADINRVVSVMIIILLLGLAVNSLIFYRLELYVRKRWGFLT